MTNHESSDLLKKVERYEAAVQELEAAHEDVKDVLIQAILFARWQQLGARLGFSAVDPAQQREEPNRDLQQLNQQISAMSESWAH
jgi:LPS sulfotransferase NodH